MHASNANLIVQGLRNVDLQVDSDKDGYVVALRGQDIDYRSGSFTKSQAETIVRFLREFRRRNSKSPETSVAKVSEKYSKQYPNLSTSVVREVAERVLQRSSKEAELVEALDRRSYAEVLQGYEKAGLWGVLIMSQRDGIVCRACRELDDVAYEIYCAIEEQPLPHSDCNNQACRCRYMPIYREEDLYERVTKRTL